MREYEKGRGKEIEAEIGIKTICKRSHHISLSIYISASAIVCIIYYYRMADREKKRET